MLSSPAVRVPGRCAQLRLQFLAFHPQRSVIPDQGDMSDVHDATGVWQILLPFLLSGPQTWRLELQQPLIKSHEEKTTGCGWQSRSTWATWALASVALPWESWTVHLQTFLYEERYLHAVCISHWLYFNIFLIKPLFFSCYAQLKLTLTDVPDHNELAKFSSDPFCSQQLPFF